MAGLTESVPVGSYAWPALSLSLWLAIGACAWVPEGKGFPETPEPIVVTATIGGEALFALFDRGSSTLNEPSEAALSDLVSAQRQRFQEISSIEVVGHDENAGNEAGSLAISLERARSVADFLNSAYPDVPIEVRGVGASAPLASNKTPEGRQLNRRVEVQIAARSVHAMDASVPESSPVPSRARGGIDLLLPFSHWIPFESGRTDLPESSSGDVEAVLVALRRTALDCPVPLTVELVGSNDPDGNSVASQRVV